MNGIRLEKIFGVDIHVDWSWFVIFMLSTWSLLSRLGRSTAHELAHALAAISIGGQIIPSRAVLFIE